MVKSSGRRRERQGEYNLLGQPGVVCISPGFSTSNPSVFGSFSVNAGAGTLISLLRNTAIRVLHYTRLLPEVLVAMMDGG